jgi:hypothetical protein
LVVVLVVGLVVVDVFVVPVLDVVPDVVPEDFDVEDFDDVVGFVVVVVFLVDDVDDVDDFEDDDGVTVALGWRPWHEPILVLGDPYADKLQATFLSTGALMPGTEP